MEHHSTIAVGERAPGFQELLGVDGRSCSISSFDDRPVLVVLFMANRCTAAQAYTSRLNAIASDYGPRGVQLVAINSDDPSLEPSESYPEMVRAARERSYAFPYLKDEDGMVARAYGALLTLHTFLLDSDRVLRYQGRIDDSPNPGFVRSNDLRNALDDVLANREVRVKETEPFPCGVDKFVSCPSCGSRP